MRAIQISRIGGPEVLTLRDLPVPVPQAGEALVRVKAAGINFVDVYFREGRYSAQLPFVPGQEGAGIVEQVGGDAGNISPGRRVAWSGVQGSYAEYAIVPVKALVPIPDPLGFEEATAAMVQGMTAHYLSHSTYPIKAGDDVLIHAGAGGVGLLLTQMAKMRGARVFTTVSTPAKAEISRAAGADEVIDYTSEDFARVVRERTGGAGVHVVYDGVGKTTFDKSLASLRRRGMMALFGGASGAVPPFDLIELSRIGSLFVTRPTLKDHLAEPGELEWRANDVFNWIVQKKLTLRIEHVYPLEDAAQAQCDLEGRKTTGKLVLAIE